MPSHCPAIAFYSMLLPGRLTLKQAHCILQPYHRCLKKLLICVTFLNKQRVLLFFFNCYQKKHKLFFYQCQARKNSNNGARVHTLGQSSESSGSWLKVAHRSAQHCVAVKASERLHEVEKFSFKLALCLAFKYI